MKALDGYKTYIVAALVAIVTGLDLAEVITPDVTAKIYGALAALGLYTVRSGIAKAAPVILAVLAFGLASTPAHAADHPSKAFGCGGGTCSIYFVSASWPPAIGVNAVEWVRGAFGVGIGGVHVDGDMSIIGGICLIPKVGEQLGPFCPQRSVDGA